MKELRIVFICAISIMLSVNVLATDKNKEGEEESSNLEFNDINLLPTTSVKNQYRTGTCWSFSAISLIESELLRLGKPEIDLSEMFVVWHTYSEKAQKYIRLHGNMNFTAGGEFHDVINTINKFGIVPEEVYNGINYGGEIHAHSEMDRMLENFVDSVVNQRNLMVESGWDEPFYEILNKYLGKIPESFYYEGVLYTPESFAKDYLGLNCEDYIGISSYTHHPFYSKFKLEVPDNWAWGEIYNVPLNEMEEIIDNALENGYTVAWAADVTEKGFMTRDRGLAFVPEAEFDQELYASLNNSEGVNKRFNEQKITQEMRQEAFDNFQTTDDHGMHIIGTAKDQNGEIYYKVKNTWGDYNQYDGYFYASKPYVNYKTTSIMVNKNALPKQILKKLGL